MSDKPWVCPSCGRGVAPGEKTCDHGSAVVDPYSTTPWIPTTNPPWPEAPYPDYLTVRG
jgi:hypothetical protein